MSAEDHYLDALEALDNDDREKALEEAYKAVKLDEEHVDACRLYLTPICHLQGFLQA